MRFAVGGVDGGKKKRNNNVDQSRLAEKTEEKRDLDEGHRRTMNELRQRIKYNFNHDICGPAVIRNEVMKKSRSRRHRSNAFRSWRSRRRTKMWISRVWLKD